MTCGLCYGLSRHFVTRNDIFNLQTSQLGYSHLMKQRKNSCCLSDSEFTSLGLNLVTVFSRRCFSFLSNVLSFFLAIKKKEYLVRGLGLHKPQYISIFHINNKINIITLQKSYYPFSLSVQNPVLIEFLPNLFSILSIHSASFLSFSDTESNKNNCSESL